jgi:hypothetical protein
VQCRGGDVDDFGARAPGTCAHAASELLGVELFGELLTDVLETGLDEDWLSRPSPFVVRRNGADEDRCGRDTSLGPMTTSARGWRM